MKQYDIAHLNIQGQDIIIVPMDGQQMHLASTEKKGETELFIQNCARAAGLAGTVCLVWEFGHQFYFLAPRPWHQFFRSLDMTRVAYSLNKKISCSEQIDYLYRPEHIEYYRDTLPKPDKKEERSELSDSDRPTNEKNGNNKTA